MKYDFGTTSDRNEVDSGKWGIKNEQFPNLKKDVAPFNSADMKFKNAPEVIGGLRKRLDNLILGYHASAERFFNSIINWDKKRHNVDIKREWIIEVLAIINGFFTVINASTKKGDSVVTMKPVYDPFGLTIKMDGRVMTDVALTSNGRNSYLVDFEKFESECEKDKSRMVILCNPHNPGEVLWGKGDLEKIIKIVNESDVVVVVDEIW